MSNHGLSASEAAERLGVTTKALRLYERRGLVTPGRTAAGYRTYGPDEILRASEIVALRALGLSLAQVARVLDGDPQSLESALGAHEVSLERKIRELVSSIDKIRGIRAGPAARCPPSERWRVCETPPANSIPPLISLGLGAATGSSFAKSDRSTTSSALWEAARHGWQCVWPKHCQMPHSWAWSG